MVDRIEELLEGLAAEDDEGQEDALALGTAAVPASPRGGGEEAGAGEAAAAETGLPPVETGERGGGRTAGEIAAEGPGLIAGEGAEERPGMAAGGSAAGRPGSEAGDAAQALQKDGLVWTVRTAAEMDAAQGLALKKRMEQRPEDPQTARDGGTAAADALRTVRDGGAAAFEAGGRTVFTAARAGAEWAAQMRTAGPVPEGARGAAPDRAGLEGLYRQTVRAVWPAAPALPRETAGRPARAREPGDAAALAVDALDRAVRRDSRRYDGGMSIF